jgi:Transposase/DDE superfamily endonuclease
MPPQRTPLGSISGNRPKGSEISPYMRGQIKGQADCGASHSSIAKDLKVLKSTVQYTLRQDELRNNGQSLPRKPRGKSYTDSEERLLLRHVRLNPKDTYKQVITACNLSCKPTTVKKILKKHGISNWRAKKRPELTEAHALARLAWCLVRKGWTAEEWGLVCWSDECSVERGRGKRAEWCFRTPAQKWDRKMVQTYDTNKNMKIMVWGCFWDTGRSNCYIMDRDFESAKHGYSARSYLEVCEAEVAPIFQELDDGYLFMQDNASIHTAYSVRDWFTAHGITQITNWPAYSPDLNPIEHIWWHLKVRVYEMFPEVAADKSESEHARQRLESCIQAAWDTLDKGIFDNLYASMPARMAACIAAGGWHTKY